MRDEDEKKIRELLIAAPLDYQPSSTDKPKKLIAT